MKKQIPAYIITDQEAESLLLELCESNDQFQPEDDINEIEFETLHQDQPTDEDRASLSVLMEQIYRFDDFDPFEFVTKMHYPEYNF